SITMKCLNFFKDGKFIAGLVFFLFLSLPSFSLVPHPIGIQMGLGTQATVYGDQTVISQRETNFPSESTRFVMNGEFSGFLFLDEYIALDLGTNLAFDWFKYSADSMFLLEYDVFFGARIYPVQAGFCFGIDYVCGGYSNFLKIDGQKENIKGDWSNGFRVVAEYNILNNKIGWSPVVGVYYQNLPRAGGYNNTFAIYAKASLR
ncbi:MAG: hypothetical protein K5839_03615, partial [Treponemataceae bacterium]|nr:hypothetical protein [Treponemataceae bacterium]